MTATTNALLASLPRSAYRALLPGLVPVTLLLHEVLYEPGQAMRQVYFPTTSLVSLLVVMQEKTALEIALVGRDGMVGIPLALGAAVSPWRALVQGTGDALRMNRLEFNAASRRHPSLRQAVQGNARALLGQIARTAACNRFHLLEPRLARWLLMTRDRLESSEFTMTQEFLSTMLAVRRVGVSDAASSFQRRHLIEYSRGHITILDHKGLEAACCSCYAEDAAVPDALVSWRPPLPRPRLPRA